MSISEKVVLKVSDLATWIVDDVKWERGAVAVWERQCSTPPLTPPPPQPTNTSQQEDQLSVPVDSSLVLSAGHLSADWQQPAATYGVLDMRDVNKEKMALGRFSTFFFFSFLLWFDFNGCVKSA